MCVHGDHQAVIGDHGGDRELDPAFRWPHGNDTVVTGNSKGTCVFG